MTTGTSPGQTVYGEKIWSIMVYLAGGRDISGEARESLLQMKQVGSTENVNVIAQFDSGSEGTFTKRYHLKPLKNAIGIQTLLRKACLEVPALSNPSDSTVGKYYYQRLVDILPEDHGKKFQNRYPQGEMIDLLKYDPARFKNSVLDFILDQDLDKEDGNQGDTNAGDPKVLVEFVHWAKEKYRSKHTMVIIWGHGSGLSVAWDFPASPLVGSKDSLAVRELSDAVGALPATRNSEHGPKRDVKSSHKIDILGFNSCSLGTIEVYRQLKDLVHFGVASEGFTPRTSWPFDKILKALNERIGMSPKEFTRTIVAKYVDHYKGSVEAAAQLRLAERQLGIEGLGTGLDLNKGPDLGQGKGPDLGQAKGPDLGQGKGPDLAAAKGPDLGAAKGPDLGPLGDRGRRGVDLSACDLDRSLEVTEEMKSLVRLLRAKLEGKVNRNVLGAILAAHSIGQSYFNKDFTDLHDFCRALESFCSDRKIRDACRKVRQAIEAMCYKRESVGDDVRNSIGISIYFPWGDWEENDARYREKDFMFLADTEWNKFLSKYRALVNAFEKEPFKPVAVIEEAKRKSAS